MKAKGDAEIKAKVLILLTLLAILLASTMACGGGEGDQPMPSPNGGTEGALPTLHVYTNSEFGYSIAYPKGWQFEQINPNEIAIMPEDSEYNQIQIASHRGEPMLRSMPDSLVAALQETGIGQFIDLLGGRNLNIVINERASGKWDWVVFFTFLYEGTPLAGEALVKETQSTYYAITRVQANVTDWPEGQDVMDSFTVEDSGGGGGQPTSTLTPQATPAVTPTSPSAAQGHLEQGDEYLAAEEWDKAIAEYTEAIELDSNLAMAYSNRAHAYAYKGQYDQAIADFSKVIELDPNDAEAYCFRGAAYALQGKKAGAITDLETCKALSDDPAVIQAANYMLQTLRE